MPIKTPVKKKQSFLSKLIPTTRKAKIITFVAAFAVIGGGFMVYRSFAYSLPTYLKGSIGYKNEGTKKYSNRFTSDGTVCVDHGFYRGLDDGGGQYYRIRVQQLVNGKWNNMRESGRTNYILNNPNGKPNRTCWYNAFASWYTYRLQIDPVDDGFLVFSARTNGTFKYTIWGYNVNKMGNEGNTKSPEKINPTPEPTPTPQPSK